MNTGAGDATDLAWKLAGTLQGWGGPGLLASYEDERRAIGERNVAASRRAASGRRTWRAAWTPELAEDSRAGEAARRNLAEVAEREQRWSNDLPGIELGYRYLDTPLVVQEPGGPDPNSFAYVPTSRPGARLPHAWLDDGSALHDRLGHRYTLLRAPGAHDSGIAGAFERAGVPFASLEIESAVMEGHPLLLVRPDLHVVWRGTEVDADRLAAIATGHLDVRVTERVAA
jgi:FAD binding domain-containing protein/aromatic ring hydroxylase-like protein